MAGVTRSRKHSLKVVLLLLDVQKIEAKGVSGRDGREHEPREKV